MLPSFVLVPAPSGRYQEVEQPAPALQKIVGKPARRYFAKNLL